jgi:hypothetical protein
LVEPIDRERWGKEYLAKQVIYVTDSRAALQNAASIAGLLLTTEAMISDFPRDAAVTQCQAPRAAWTFNRLRYERNADEHYNLSDRLQYLLAITKLDSVFETFDREPTEISSFAPCAERLKKPLTIDVRATTD